MNLNKPTRRYRRLFVAAGTAVMAVAVVALAGVHLACKGGVDANSLGGAIGCVLQGGGGGAGGSDSDRLVQGVQGGVSAMQALSLTAEREDGIGQSVAVSLTNEYELSDDEELTRYVSMVGLTLADASDRPVGNWLFGVLESNEVNAYAAPNGYIFVTRGALERMRDESELAGVLAHEMTHVLNHHGLEAVKQSGFWQGAAKVGSAVSDDVAQFSGAIDAGVDLIVHKGYGRAQEHDADRGAIELMVAAGYDPAGYVRFLRKLEGGGGLFSTHPGGADRVQKVQSQIDRMGARGGATLKDRYARYVFGE